MTLLEKVHHHGRGAVQVGSGLSGRRIGRLIPAILLSRPVCCSRSLNVADRGLRGCFLYSGALSRSSSAVRWLPETFKTESSASCASLIGSKLDVFAGWIGNLGLEVRRELCDQRRRNAVALVLGCTTWKARQGGALLRHVKRADRSSCCAYCCRRWRLELTSLHIVDDTDDGGEEAGNKRVTRSTMLISGSMWVRFESFIPDSDVLPRKDPFVKWWPV